MEPYIPEILFVSHRWLVYAEQRHLHLMHATQIYVS